MKTNELILPNVDVFNIPLTNGATSFGSDQGWYTTDWQVRAGCGPSTAANMFAYWAIKNPQAAPICPPFNKTAMLSLMEDTWQYITPTPKGVNTTKLFVDGVKEYAAQKKQPLTPFSLDVTNQICRPPEGEEAFIQFIRQGLQKGCPVAFLNLSNGALHNLHHWHWVTLMGIWQENGHFYALASDEGDKKVFDMSLWYETTKLGGGLVYFTL